MRNSHFFERNAPERKNPFLPGNWLKEIYAPFTVDLPRAIPKEKEEYTR